MSKRGYLRRMLSACIATVMVITLASCNGGNQGNASAGPGSGSANPGPGSSDAAKFDGEIVIGACSDLTGAGASNGQGEANAFQMIADEINANGGVLGKKLVINMEDTNGTSEGAVNAMNRQVSNPDVVAVVGFMYSSQVLAVADIAKQAKVPLMYGGSSPSINELDNDYIFRMRPADNFVVELALDYVVANFKPTKLGILYSMGDYGMQGFGVAKAYCERNNLNYVADGFTDGTKDFYSNILKLKDAGCDAMLWWAHEEELAIITRQRLELEYDVPVFACSAMGDVKYTSLISNDMCEGLLGIAESAESNDWEPYTKFAERYQEAYGELPNNNICGLGPAIYLLADCIERAGSTESEAICEALRETKNFASLSGYLTCDELQNLNHNSIIFRMTDGKRKFVELFTQEID